MDKQVQKYLDNISETFSNADGGIKLNCLYEALDEDDELNQKQAKLKDIVYSTIEIFSAIIELAEVTYKKDA